MGKFLILTLCIFLLAAVVACGLDDDDENNGAGWTGDVGGECVIPCYDDWCKSSDQIDCASGFCVGTEGDLYCTVPCDLDNQCPAGFLCSDECNTHVAKDPACVKQEHWAILQDLGFCP